MCFHVRGRHLSQKTIPQISSRLAGLSVVIDLEEKKRQKAAAELAALEEKMVFMHLAGEV